MNFRPFGTELDAPEPWREKKIKPVLGFMKSN